MPTLRRGDLTDEEEAIVKQWRLREHHELDCLRWIEGRRYDPHQDQEFKKEVHKALLKACFLHEQEPPSFSP